MPQQAILFLTDTQGANCIECYGVPGLGTPNLDGLAAGGLRFDRAYTCQPVCGPARSAIFTGVYPHSNGVLANGHSPHQDIPTLGQRLKDAGIHTGYIGKWHLDGTDYFGDGRCPEGWDPAYWFDGRNYLESLPNDAARTLSRQVLGPREVAKHGITAEFTHAHRTANRARDFIAKHKNENFFLVVSIDEPHHPAICPEPFVSAFDDFLFPIPNLDDPLEEKPQAQKEWADYARTGMQSYIVREGDDAFFKCPGHFACNSYCDYEIGRVLEEIKAQVPGALVVATSDHGDMLGSHGLTGKGPAMYEEVTRIPLLVSWPGQVPEGSSSSSLTSHVDLAPTFLEYFGIEPPQLLQGQSLLNVFRNPSTKVNEYVFSEFNRFEIAHDGYGAFAPIRCVADGRYKLSMSLIDSDELYDLENDPGELRNLISVPEAAAIRERLHAELMAWMDRTRDPLRGPHWKRKGWVEKEESTWAGPSRSRPADLTYYPPSTSYLTGLPVKL